MIKFQAGYLVPEWIRSFQEYWLEMAANAYRDQRESKDRLHLEIYVQWVLTEMTHYQFYFLSWICTRKLNGSQKKYWAIEASGSQRRKQPIWYWGTCQFPLLLYKKTLTKSSVVEERLYLAYTSRSQSITEGSSVRSSRQGPKGKPACSLTQHYLWSRNSFIVRKHNRKLDGCCLLGSSQAHSWLDHLSREWRPLPWWTRPSHINQQSRWLLTDMAIG